MEDILKELGFNHLTGPIWKHDKIGMFHFFEEDKPKDIVGRIYDRGHSECQEMIKASLGIETKT